jgi:hypothetical protein
MRARSDRETCPASDLSRDHTVLAMINFLPQNGITGGVGKAHVQSSNASTFD